MHTDDFCHSWLQYYSPRIIFPPLPPALSSPCPLFPLPSLPPLPFPRSFPSPSLRLKIFSTPRAKCLYFVRRLQSGPTPPSSAPSTSTGSAMTNQERPSLQVKYEHGKPHSSALRYGTVLTFCSMYTNGLLKV